MSVAPARTDGALVVRRGPPPPPSRPRPRASRWLGVCRAAGALRPGEWFIAGLDRGPGLPTGLSTYERAKCAAYLRAWLRREGVSGVEVYRDDQGHIVVRRAGGAS